MTRLFLDANVLFTAAHNPQGKAAMQEGYRIDTNVISELRRREPEPRVVHWFEQKPAGQLYLSVLTLGEIRRGVEKLQQGER